MGLLQRSVLHECAEKTAFSHIAILRPRPCKSGKGKTYETALSCGFDENATDLFVSSDDFWTGTLECVELNNTSRWYYFSHLYCSPFYQFLPCDVCSKIRAIFILLHTRDNGEQYIVFIAEYFDDALIHSTGDIHSIDAYFRLLVESFPYD